MSFHDDKYLDVCQHIEAGLKANYDRDPTLTDERCIYALERLTSYGAIGSSTTTCC